jgi:hypothetical protein
LPRDAEVAAALAEVADHRAVVGVISDGRIEPDGPARIDDFHVPRFAIEVSEAQVAGGAVEIRDARSAM